jgi:hypothetical protein
MLRADFVTRLTWLFSWQDSLMYHRLNIGVFHLHFRTKITYCNFLILRNGLHYLHTLPWLPVPVRVRLENVFCSKSLLNWSWFTNFKVSFSNTGFDGHSPFQYSGNDMSMRNLHTYSNFPRKVAYTRYDVLRFAVQMNIKIAYLNPSYLHSPDRTARVD